MAKKRISFHKPVLGIERKRRHRKAQPAVVTGLRPATAVDPMFEAKCRAAWDVWQSGPRNTETFAAMRRAIREHCFTAREEFDEDAWDIWEWLEVGDQGDLRVPTAFLEADPWYHGSGYRKTEVIKRITRAPIPPEYAKRLRKVVLRVVDTRDAREFRSYCRLARHVDSPELCSELRMRLDHADPAVRRRARWVLDALGA